MTTDVSNEALVDAALENDEEGSLNAEIADEMAALSTSETMPKGWGRRTEPFSSDKVDFATNAWLVRLHAVSPWLHLDESLPKPGNGPPAFVEKLFFLLGRPPSPPSFDLIDGIVRMSSDARKALSSRLETAVRLRDYFVEQLEDQSRVAASAAWEARWEEQIQDDAELEPIHATVETYKISNFRELAVHGKMNLNPTFQRGDVWATTDSQKLIDSIIRGIPLPSIIILKAQAGRRFDIVDGKQRLTAILRFMGKHPNALALVKKTDRELSLGGVLEQAFHEDYRRRFRDLWKEHKGERLTTTLEAEYYFPFVLPPKEKLPVGLKLLGGKFYSEVKDVGIKVASHPTSLDELFDGPSPPYQIPVIVYNDTNPRQIHMVFELYNKQGKHLNAEEIRNAVYHDVALTKLLLAAAGDNADFDVLAKFVPPEGRERMSVIADSLARYKFGTTRYKRTKILSWLCAVLLQPSQDKNGAFAVRSTTSHINALFTSIRGESGHVMRLEPALLKLIEVIGRGIQAHSEVAWPEKFKDDDQGERWQELQLVASLTGVTLLGMIDEDPSTTLERRALEIAQFMETNLRLEKTQNKEQWEYIGRIALGILDLCEVDQAALEIKIVGEFKFSCLSTLRGARDRQ